VSRPLRLLWALPKVNGVYVVLTKEHLDLVSNWEDGFLKGVRLRLQDFPCRIDGVGDCSDFVDVIVV